MPEAKRVEKIKEYNQARDYSAFIRNWYPITSNALHFLLLRIHRFIEDTTRRLFFVKPING